jgi:hypothetical protein
MKKRYPLIIILGGLFALFLCVAVRYFRQAEAIQHVEQTGGYVKWISHGPTWLVRLCGDAYPLRSVELVELGSQCSDQDLSEIESLRQARILFLNGAKVNGQGLATLKNWPRLETLDLTKCTISDDGVQYVTASRGLKTLSLARTQVSDSGLFFLADLRSLEELDLEDTSVTDRGLQALSHLSLKRLNVRRTMVTDQGVAQLMSNNSAVHVVR